MSLENVNVLSFFLGFLLSIAVSLIGLMVFRKRRSAKESKDEIKNSLFYLANNLPDFISIKNKDLKFIFVNKCFIDWVKIPREEIIGKTVYDIYPPEQAHQFDFWDKEALRKKEVISRDIDLLYPDGNIRSVISIRIPLESPSGDIIGLGTINLDITQRKKVEKELSIAKKQAEAASSLKSKFLANISHELRTPLNAIIGFSEIMKDEILGPLENKTYTSYACNIYESGKFLLEIINDLLDLSKIESENFKIEEEEFDYIESIYKSINILHDMIKRKNAHADLYIFGKIYNLYDIVSKNYEPELFNTINIYGDKKLIIQSLLNLIANATKFMPDYGSLTIEVAINHDGQLVTSVRNSGEGVPEEKIPELFEPFTQLSDSYVRSAQGSGLGLALVRSFIRLHGGTVTMTSTVGKDTTLTITLPGERIISQSHEVAG